MKKLIMIIIILMTTVLYSYGQVVGDTDFAALSMHAIQKGKEIVGKEYIYGGGCDQF